MDNFKNMLEKQMQKAKAGSAPAEPAAEVKPRGDDGSEATPENVKKTVAPASSGKSKKSGQGRGRSEDVAPKSRQQAATPSANLNRVTVNLFDSDRRALAVIKEKLGTAGHDFTNRSDSIKVALRIAAKAKREELVQAFEQVKAEDRRFKNVE